MSIRSVDLGGSQSGALQEYHVLHLLTQAYHAHDVSLSTIAALTEVDLAASHDLVRDFLCSQYKMDSNVFLVDVRSFIGHVNDTREVNEAADKGSDQNLWSDQDA